MRKHEIHLPLNYPDGEPIEHEKVKRVHAELLATFGSFALPHRRAWKYDGFQYVEIVKFEIVTTSDKVPQEILTDLKQRLRKSRRQIDILITTHSIQFI